MPKDQQVSEFELTPVFLMMQNPLSEGLNVCEKKKKTLLGENGDEKARPCSLVTGKSGLKFAELSTWHEDLQLALTLWAGLKARTCSMVVHKAVPEDANV